MRFSLVVTSIVIFLGAYAFAQDDLEMATDNVQTMPAPGAQPKQNQKQQQQKPAPTQHQHQPQPQKTRAPSASKPQKQDDQFPYSDDDIVNGSVDGVPPPQNMPVDQD